VYTPVDLAKPKQTSFGDTYGAEKRGLEFGKGEYDIIDAHCKNIGVKWFASVWDVPSVDFMMQYDVPWLKLASCCCNHWELLMKVAEAGRKSILSVGMSTSTEIDRAVDILEDNLEYMLYTTSIYPCPDNLVNLTAMLDLSFKYRDACKIGFSSHSDKVIYPSASAAMGAKMIEFHITLDRGLPGADHAASIGPVGVKRIADHVNSLNSGIGMGWHEPSEEELSKGRKYPWRD